MSKGLLLPILAVLALCEGCLINNKQYDERMDSFEEQQGGAWGVRLRDRPDCIQIDMGGLALDGPWSFDAFLQADERAGFVSPVVVWPGVFAFLQDTDGYVIAAPASNPVPSGGASSPSQLMDGGRHHVALNYGSDGVMALYIDGALKSSAPVALDQAPEDTLEIGCWTGKGYTFSGAIAEARLSRAALHDGSFDVVWEPYEVEQATIALWHLDEGAGSEIHDEQDSYPGVLVGGAWERFSLSQE